MSFHGDCNMTQTKKNRYSDEEKWSAFCLPLQEWMASNEDSDDEDILDQIATANQQMNRGNRKAENRPKAVKLLKIEFGSYDFADSWKTERLDKNIVKKMTKAAKRNRPHHKAFFHASNRVFTFTKDKVQYAIVDENVYANREVEKDLTHFKALHRAGLNWESPIYAVYVEPVEDDDEE